MHTSTVQDITRQSRIASRQLSSTPESLRNFALATMADSLESVKQQVLDINAQEVAKARQELPLLRSAFDTNAIELRGCEETKKILQGISPATGMLT